MKRFSIIIVLILFLYAGVAWAFEECSHALGHPNHAGLRHESHDTTLPEPVSSGNLPTDSSAAIHCLQLSHQVGPIINGLQVRFSRHSSDGVPLRNLAAPKSEILFDDVNEYPLKFLSFRSASISFPERSAFYVFLGVLLI